jgi:Fur family ferric uptake transcriptional regulator
MTRAPEVAPMQFEDLADAIRELREAGLRLSTPRRLVLEALFAADSPVTAADLARDLSVDESSVYRNLELFEQRGIVRHVHLGHSPGLYTLARGTETEYLYCEHYGTVTAVTPQRLDPVRKHIQHDFGYSARFTHFPIVGICDQCAAAPADAPSRPAATNSENHSPAILPIVPGATAHERSDHRRFTGRYASGSHRRSLVRDQAGSTEAGRD